MSTYVMATTTTNKLQFRVMINTLKSSFKAWKDIQMGRKWNCTRNLENWHLNEFKCQTPVLDSLLNIDPKEANVQDGLIIRLCHQSGLLQEEGNGWEEYQVLLT